MLKAYDDYRQGTGAEVMEWIKDQTRHRQSLERKRTEGSEKRLDRAQNYALIAALVGLVVAAAIAYLGNTLAAVVFAIIFGGGPSATTVLARFLDRVDTKN
jgi:hypothetical protein